MDINKLPIKDILTIECFIHGKANKIKEKCAVVAVAIAVRYFTIAVRYFNNATLKFTAVASVAVAHNASDVHKAMVSARRRQSFNYSFHLHKFFTRFGRLMPLEDSYQLS